MLSIAWNSMRLGDTAHQKTINRVQNSASGSGMGEEGGGLRVVKAQGSSDYVNKENLISI